MPNQRGSKAVRPEFTADSLVTTNLSGAAFTGDWLWVAGGEACGIDRLRRLAPAGPEVLRFGEADTHRATVRHDEAAHARQPPPSV